MLTKTPFLLEIRHGTAINPTSLCVQNFPPGANSASVRTPPNFGVTGIKNEGRDIFECLLSLTVSNLRVYDGIIYCGSKRQATEVFGCRSHHCCVAHE